MALGNCYKPLFTKNSYSKVIPSFNLTGFFVSKPVDNKKLNNETMEIETAFKKPSGLKQFKIWLL